MELNVLDIIRKKTCKIAPVQVLVIGFFSIIFFGAVLLTLPIASRDGQSLNFLDALFTSTSAVCVTGLVVVDTVTQFTVFGQMVIILLIQAGGLGFMTLATLLFLLIGKRISLRERLIIQESLNEDTLQGLVRLVRNVVVATLTLETFGACLLMTRFIPVYGFVKGIYYSFFHAVSAFCNAGFDLMGSAGSLTEYRGDLIVSGTIMLMIMLGGLGFQVLVDIYRKRNFHKLKFHSKFVIFNTVVLILFGAVAFYLTEISNVNTLGNPELNTGTRVLMSFFQSVTPRTAGFATMNQGYLTSVGKLLTMILMFIGANSASTGGGVKTTTFAVILFMVASVIRGKSDLNIGKRRISYDILYRAVAIVVISLLLVIIIAMAVMSFEAGKAGMSFENVLFETFSAFGTVGLSTGITSSLSAGSKICLIFTMFSGRLGPLTMTLAFANRLANNRTKIRYPEEKIMVG